MKLEHSSFGKHRHQAPRNTIAIKQRPDYRRGYRRLLLAHLIWPILAVLLVGGIGSLLVRQEMLGAWLVLIFLVLAGGFVSVPGAIILGGVVFVTAIPFLFFLQSVGRLGGELFLLVALLPFASVLLAAARAQQVKATRLHMLLNLPQVRAATDVSDWSLLPKPPLPIRRRTGSHGASLRLALQPATPAVSSRQQSPLASDKGLAQTQTRIVQEKPALPSGM